MAEETETLPPSPFRLRSIYLRESQVQLAPSFDPTLPGQELNGRYRVSKSTVAKRKTDFSDGQSLIAYEFNTAFEFVQTAPISDDETEEEVEAKTLSKISCSFTVQYAVTDTEPDEKTLAQWATKQVVFQLWPYFREFCHDMTARMALPSAPIPFLEINLITNNLPVEIEEADKPA